MTKPIFLDQLEDIYRNKPQAQAIFSLGFPALGKTTSLRNLPAEHSYVIVAEKVDLPMPLAAGLVPDRDAKGKEGSLLWTNDPKVILKTFDNLAKRPEIKYVIIDDGTYIMTAEFMSKINISGWDKFNKMAANLWDLIREGKNRLRPDQKFIFLGHLEEHEGMLIMRSMGKMTREKLVPEGLVSTIFVPGVDRDTKEEKTNYYFTTQSDGKTPARSIFDMYPYKVPNDMMLLMNRMDEYYKGVPLDNSQFDFELVPLRNRVKSSHRR